MSELSTDFKRFQTELSILVNESSEAKRHSDFKTLLIRINSLQRIVYEEINNNKAKNN